MDGFGRLTLVMLAAVVLVLLLGQGLQAEPLTAANGLGVRCERLTINTTGADGSATGSQATGATVSGRVVRVDVDYTAAITNATGTDLTVVGSNDLLATNIVNLTDTYTDTQLFPTVEQTDNAGSGRSTYDYYPVADELTVSLAETNAFTPAVTVEICWAE